MLALTLTKNQRILISDDIIVQVVEIKGDRIKLGITAPNGVEVDREEIRTAKINTGHYSPRKGRA